MARIFTADNHQSLDYTSRDGAPAGLGPVQGFRPDLSGLREIKRRIGSAVPKPLLRFLRRHTVLFYRRHWGPRIPIAMITGTKGKTTTTRMLAHILDTAGHRVGFSTTDGVVIDGEVMSRYDAGGYVGAREVFRHRDITAAVLETGRGGVLRNGFFIDRCDVAALLNVGREQIGIDGIDTLEDMAALKQRVLNAARVAAVLNADDAQCQRLIRHYPPWRTILFSMRADSPVVEDHIRRGGSAFVLNETAEGGGTIERSDEDSRVPVIAIADLPSCHNGLFPQNIANALAAAALARGLAVPLATIGAALKSFDTSLEHSPGRFNFLEGYAQTVLLDRAGEIPSTAALVESVDRIAVPGHRLCMVETMGNRPDWHFTELTEILAPHFDRFVCYDVEPYRRGRAPGEIADLLKTGLVAAGVPPERIATAEGFAEATKTLAEIAAPDDLAVVLVHDSHIYLPIFRELFARHRLRPDD